jgi:chitinase
VGRGTGPEKQVFVSYEDPQSLDEKCRYIRAHRLGGIMIWNYASDDAQGTLLKTIDAELLTSAHHRR